jgi:hypothetical protein
LVIDEGGEEGDLTEVLESLVSRSDVREVGEMEDRVRGALVGFTSGVAFRSRLRLIEFDPAREVSE